MTGRGTRAAGRIVLLLLAAAAFVGIVAARGGPPPGGDTVAVTAVTTDLSHGRLHAAAALDGVPDPPGYPLLAASLVVLARPLIGASDWCWHPGTGHDSGGGPAPCGGDPALPPWYRGQGVLALVAWVVLAAGARAWLRACGAPEWAEVVALAALVLLPSASSSVVGLYHPQDLLALGFAGFALAEERRGRLWSAGALLGLAMATKQFAVLVLIPALTVADGWRARTRLAGSAAAVLAAVVGPFLVAAPGPTLSNLTGTGPGGAVAGSTAVSLLHLGGPVASVVARDAPVAFAVAVAVWARRRRGEALATPEVTAGLVLACLAGRLVFESVVFPYYLLATSVAVVSLDLVRGVRPVWALTWCAAAASFVALRPGSSTVVALGTLALALAAVGAGLRAVARPTPTRLGVSTATRAVLS